MKEELFFSNNKNNTLKKKQCYHIIRYNKVFLNQTLNFHWKPEKQVKSIHKTLDSLLQLYSKSGSFASRFD